jgi:hypothetical protein
VENTLMARLVIKRNRRGGETPAAELLEVVAPRTNAALITPAENLCGALALHTGGYGGGPVALEIVGDSERSRFLIRTSTRIQQSQLCGQVAAAYPQATLRPLDAATMPGGDPQRVAPHEQIAAYTLALHAGDHLPIRTFQDRDMDADAGSAQADPVLGVLGALHDLPPGWRAVSQLVLLEPPPLDWARAYQRLALENPVAAERSTGQGGGTSLSGLLTLFALGLAAVMGLNAWTAWQQDDWFALMAIAGGTVAGFGLAIAAYLRFGRRHLHDPRLVQDKLSRDACRVELRLGVIAPGHTSSSALRERLERLAAAYRPFALAAGNSFVP